ncbi:MAG: protein kinase [Candidatus Krumholzibacteriia bacterium]
MIGQTVLHYKVSEKLGEGGMGVVYKAEDSKLRRAVALKFLQPHIFNSDAGRARFIHEAQAAAALDHPNICTIYEIDEANDQTFISMAHVEGVSLREKIRSGAFELAEALEIVIQVAEGLQAAHAKGVVHRDVKSANIMVTPDGQVKIMDFGLAKLSGRTRVTKTGTAMGTIEYMSPEQASGGSIDHRTDIWSLGVVLYEMVAGHLPFDGEYDQAVVYSIIHDDAAPIKIDLPVDVERITNKALAKRPDDRYQTASEFVIDLKALERDLTSAMTKTEVSPSRPQLSIAVLPFANMSPDKEQEYFCDGMAEDIINDLTKVEGLRVVSRTSSFTFKGRNEDIREIGRKLRVKTLLEGSVRKAGSRLRITAQLINVSDGYHIWSQRYDREMEDVFAIQDEISQNIVHALEVKLTATAKRNIEKTATKDVQAYDLYLRGRQFFYQWQRKSIEYALEMFKRAIKRDPNYSLAYAGMADCYSVLFTDFDRNKENLERSLAASQQALELDADLAEAHAARGFAVSSLNKQYDEGAREFETAIRLNPKLFEAYYFYARSCRTQGKMEKAAQLFEQACLVKPEDYQAQFLLAGTYKGLNLEAGAEAAYQRGMENAERHLELNPDDSRATYLGATALIELGEREKGLEWATRAVTMDPENPLLLYNISCVFSLAGELEGAIRYFDWAIDAGYAQKEWAQGDPDLEPIRSDPRFAAILQKMK